MQPITKSGKAYGYIFDPGTNKNGVPGIFGTEYAALMDNLRQFMTALPTSDAENKALEIASGTSADFEHTMGNLNKLLNISLEGAETGYRQDIAPLIPQAQRQFQDFLSGARGDFADSNILSGSDFQRNIAGESSRLSENLAARQFEENIRAAQARGDWTTLAQNLNVLSKSFPLSYSADLYNMGEKYRKSQEEIRGRPYAMFQSLSGAENQTPFFQNGYNSTSSSAANLNALTQALSNVSSGGFGGNTTGGSNPNNPGGVNTTPGWLS